MRPPEVRAVEDRGGYAVTPSASRWMVAVAGANSAGVRQQPRAGRFEHREDAVAGGADERPEVHDTSYSTRLLMHRKFHVALHNEPTICW
jgi:hypothetical protein